jgi:hypothetical protein
LLMVPNRQGETATYLLIVPVQGTYVFAAWQTGTASLPAATSSPLRGTTWVCPLGRGTFQVPLRSALRLSLSLGGFLQTQVLKVCFILQPRAGFHSRPRISPSAQPHLLVTSDSAPLLFRKRSVTEAPAPTSRLCSAPWYVLPAWGLARRGVVPFLGFSLFQATTSTDEPDPSGQSTHGVVRF